MFEVYVGGIFSASEQKKKEKRGHKTTLFFCYVSYRRVYKPIGEHRMSFVLSIFVCLCCVGVGYLLRWNHDKGLEVDLQIDAEDLDHWLENLLCQEEAERLGKMEGSWVCQKVLIPETHYNHFQDKADQNFGGDWDQFALESMIFTDNVLSILEGGGTIQAFDEDGEEIQLFEATSIDGEIDLAIEE
jgi:hypothetical protein